MATVGIPVLIWEDHHGQYTACTLEWGYYGAQAAYDDTRSGALQQLKRYFEWLVKANDVEPETDFLNPELFHVRVRVRPEYQGSTHNRRYPCESTIELRVPCVRGTTRGDILCCSIPTLGIGFYCHDPSALQTMVTERVRQELSGHTPQELSRFMAPKNLELDQVLVRARIRRRGPDRHEDQLTALPPIAEPMADAAFRKSYSPAFRREAEVSSLGDRLRNRPGNLLLVGEDGVGKSTLLVNAVRAAERKSETGTNQGSAAGGRHSRFWHTSAARLIAGMRYLGQWQERCEEVIEELSRIGGVLCMESLIDLVRIGGSDPSASVGAFLLPYLQTGQLRLVAEATPAELDACRRLLPGVTQPFEIMHVNELAGKAAGEALDEIAAAGSRDLRVEVDEGVPHAVLRLYRRFMPYHPLPGRAGHFLRGLLDQARQEKAPCVDVEQAFGQFVRETGLPELFLDDEVPLPMADVSQALREKVIGQDAACQAVARLVCTFKTGLNDPRRPVGSLLFCGPTGVGKTQLARTLSDYLFGHGDQSGRLIRLDMSEYSAPWAAPRLVSNPDGTPSDFIGKVRKQPFVVVLFDEIEKAAPEVFDMLLGLLDEGRLTDRYGRTTWFRTAMVIMTSNLGSSNRNSIGFGEESPDTYQREIRSFFRPEFFNRLDGVVTFAPLNRETCRLVVQKELDELSSREGLAQRHVKTRFGDTLVEHLVEQGFDPQYGARPLQRTIEHQVVSRLSRFLIEKRETKRGWLEIDFDRDTNEICVRHVVA